jgi:hypothetical protein
MKWARWYIVLIAFLLGAYMYAAYKKPPVIDWRQTLSNRDKIPYGTYIVYNELQSILKQKPKELREPVYDHTNNSEATDETYILIAGGVHTDETDEEELFRYIENGNTVFISAEGVSKSFADTLGIEINAYDTDIGDRDSTSLKLVNPAFQSPDIYTNFRYTIDGYFANFDTAKAIVLGKNSNNKVNFIRIPMGEGNLYLHTAPIAFSNYFALKGNNLDYIEKVFSYLPDDNSFVYWDEYYKLGRGGPSTPLRVILGKTNLRYAYFTALIAIILFMVFQAKRRQRVIPVIKPPVNATLDFVETVSRVYFNQKHHHNIAQKKITYWLDAVRGRYSLLTHKLDEEFEAKLVHKSGVAKETVEELVSMIKYVRYHNEISDNDLMKLSRLIDQFNKQSRI